MLAAHAEKMCGFRDHPFIYICRVSITGQMQGLGAGDMETHRAHSLDDLLRANVILRSSSSQEKPASPCFALGRSHGGPSRQLSMGSSDRLGGYSTLVVKTRGHTPR